MKVKPNENYRLLGTDVTLDKDLIYSATIATNQPDYIEKSKIFVIYDIKREDGFLLERGEYTIIEP
jgi:hypothetical protein